MAKDDGKDRKDGKRSERRPRLRAKPDPRLSRSLEYGAAVLECFTAHQPLAGVVDLSEALRVGRSTAHRYAATLHALGYLEQDEHRKYRLSRLALEPGMAAIGALRARLPVVPVLAGLREKTGHTVGMGVLDGTRAIYIHRLHAHRRGQYEADRELRVGASLPLHCTALGKALLASLPPAERRALLAELALDRAGPNAIVRKRALAVDLEAIARRGLALSDQELAPGVRSLAAVLPGELHDPGRLPGADPLHIAIDVTMPVSAQPIERLAEELGPLILAAAQSCSSLWRSA